MDFLSKYKVMGLAVAFIMDIYLGTLVQTLVTGLVMPRIDLAIPGLGNLATFKTPVPQTELDSQGNSIDPNYVGQLFGVGEFLETLITFIIVAFVIFILVNPGKGHQKTAYRIISATLFFLLEHVFKR
jgi:large conductance mechanosensitive channel